LAARSSDCAARFGRALLACSIILLSGCTHLKSSTTAIGGLLELVDQRLALATEVARSKWNSGAPVEDLPREQAIIDAIGREAPRYGLTAATAMEFFRAQIEASKIAQNAQLAAWRVAAQPAFADAPDLQRDIRPQLDRLTPALLAALAQTLSTLGTAAANNHLDRYAVTSPARAAAVAPLRRASAVPD
jgi:chorismate mutase